MRLVTDISLVQRAQCTQMPALNRRRLTFTRHGMACRSSAGHGHTPTGSGDHCFALETMSEDGQAWVLDELGQKLVGLRHRTPRATCRTTQLLSYRGDMSEGDKSLRCERLDLDLGWEATSPAAEGKTFTGLAKVTMCSKDHHDVVDVAVEVDPVCLEGVDDQGGEGKRDKLVRDVVYAVESLDTAIMEKLNDFLWSMEQHNPQAAAHEQESDAGAEGADWGRA
ncbi:hypothetical protein PLESTM_000651300 [Pleodorina starrii]|nr:hypothetical protein PLESTM_000651300 [Pleodorina starrii]